MSGAGERRLVVAAVGTDHHPFDRLVSWLDPWAAEHIDSVRTVIQYGTSRPPVSAEGHDLIGRAELHALFSAADVIVSHGGPSTIVEACRLGRVPVVVARDPSLGEHVDGHQQRFARLMAARGLVRLAGTAAELHAFLDGDVTSGAPVPDVELPDPAEGAARLGRLVDELVDRRRRPRPS